LSAIYLTLTLPTLSEPESETQKNEHRLLRTLYFISKNVTDLNKQPPQNQLSEKRELSKASDKKISTRRYLQTTKHLSNFLGRYE
jgi:hypothetical protein